jgi:1-phosphofructokinase
VIRTITLNPAIDKTVEISKFSVGSVNRVTSIRTDAGGKGINVSKVIKSLGGESAALGFLAGNNGRFIKDYLDNIGIQNNFVFTHGETRVNLKVVDKVNKTNTDINEPGVIVTEDDIRELEKNIFGDTEPNSIIVFSGSVPAGIPKDIYRTWILRAKEAGMKTILDADGELLEEGIKAGPYLIKPNIHELEKLYNKKLDNIESILEVSIELFKYGIKKIVVSLGEAGAIFIETNKVLLAEGLKVEVGSTVGAGDSMVAALAYSIEQSYNLEDTVILSVATSAANVTTSGTEPASYEKILELKKNVKFSYLK